MSAIPCALYVHVPWCLRKCPYCDFNSHALVEPLPERRYLAALVRDLESALPLIAGRPFCSVFFGGGTPSLLSPEGVGWLLSEIRSRVEIPPEAEITLEANPGTLEEAFGEVRIDGFYAAGVNRISLGIQSFQDAALAALGRIHDRAAAEAAARMVSRRFEHFNLDLMYGLPGQRTVASALDDLEAALRYAPPHLSCYQLTLEPNTRFSVFPPRGLPDADLVADMGDAIEERLAEAGYTHYETSAYARSGAVCRHNLNYWRFGDYLGIGAGAHSKLTVQGVEGDFRVLRAARPRNPADYFACAAQALPLETVAPEAVSFEFLMNALRLAEGFSPALFEARVGAPLESILPRLCRADEAGLLALSPDRVVPTTQGRRFLNRLLEMLL